MGSKGQFVGLDWNREKGANLSTSGKIAGWVGLVLFY